VEAVEPRPAILGWEVPVRVSPGSAALLQNVWYVCYCIGFNLARMIEVERAL
jgi:hypothetical protein